jgi:hypothetical protein
MPTISPRPRLLHREQALVYGALKPPKPLPSNLRRKEQRIKALRKLYQMKFEVHSNAPGAEGGDEHAARPSIRPKLPSLPSKHHQISGDRRRSLEAAFLRESQQARHPTLTMSMALPQAGPGADVDAHVTLAPSCKSTALSRRLARPRSAPSIAVASDADSADEVDHPFVTHRTVTFQLAKRKPPLPPKLKAPTSSGRREEWETEVDELLAWSKGLAVDSIESLDAPEPREPGLVTFAGAYSGNILKH